jgi:hypothetical protein
VTLNLGDLEAPPANTDFRAELRRAIAQSERLARRRRRTAALVALVAGLGIASAASVSAFRGQPLKQTDASYTCAVPQQGGVNKLDVTVQVKGPPYRFGGKRIPRVAEALFNTGDVGLVGSLIFFGGVTSARHGYGVNDKVCQKAAAIPLVPAGLPLVAELRGTGGDEIQQECWLAPTVRMRLRVAYDKRGAPSAAQLALRSGAKLRPAAYIDWTPTHIRLYTSAACSKR